MDISKRLNHNEPTANNKIKPSQVDAELSTLPLVETVRGTSSFSPFLPESGTIEDAS